MKKLEAYIRHFNVEAVKEAMIKVGVSGMNVSEVRGFGRQKGHKEAYRGVEYAVDFLPKVKLETIVRDDDLEKSIEAIRSAAATGQIGDGKIFVSDVESAIRIRTGETDGATI